MSSKRIIENLWDEKCAGVKRRDSHLSNVEELVRRFHGRYFCSDSQPAMAITENYSFELMSLLIPQLAYDAPRMSFGCATPNELDDQTLAQVEPMMAAAGARSVRQFAEMNGVTVEDLAAQFGGYTMGQYVKGQELAINKWSKNNNVHEPLLEQCVDYFFAWAVGFVTTADQPGYRGVEMTPQQPLIMRLPAEHHFFDASCMTPKVFSVNGPRLMGHMWEADREDLLADESYDHEQVQILATDTDLAKYHLNEGRGGNSLKRDSVLAWEIWIPEDGFTDDELLLDWGIENPECYNGSWHTIAVAQSDRGQSKKAREIRPRRPAYVPPWGPYSIFGYQKVRNNPYPLGLIPATMEQVEALNQQTNAAAKDAQAYKRFVVGRAANAADADRIKSVPNGEMVLIDGDPKEVTQMELGGTSQQQFTQIEAERARLERLAGMSSSRSGSPNKRVTATAESIADAGTQARTAGLQSRYRAGVMDQYQTAAWYQFHGEDMATKLGEEGEAIGMEELVGGTLGRSRFKWQQVSINMDLHSMGHTDNAMLQRRFNDAITTLVSVAPVAATSPWIKWREPLSRLFSSLNVDTEDWFDDAALAASQQQSQVKDMALQNPAQQPQQPASEGGDEEDPAALADQYLAMTGGGDAMGSAQEAASVVGEAVAA